MELIHFYAARLRILQRGFVAIVLLSVCTISFPQSGSAFIDELRAAEQEEYNALIDAIKSMSDAEYRRYLLERVSTLDNEQKTVTVIVDVTDEKHAPEPGFLYKWVFGDTPEEQYGINKIGTILGDKKVNKSESSKLKFKAQFYSQDKTRMYQRLDGALSKTEMVKLVENGSIRDISLNESKESNHFGTFHTPTGRIIPPLRGKIYDQKFINDGLYNELLAEFKTKDKITVQVSLSLPNEGLSYSAIEEAAKDQELDNVLAAWRGEPYESLYRGYGYIFITTTEEHVRQLREDSRVSSIKKGQPLFAK